MSVISLSCRGQREGPYKMVGVWFRETLVAHGVGAAIVRLSPFAGHGGHRLVGGLGKDGQK